MRYCECGRELEKKCRYCSECAQINRQISNDISFHNYYNSEIGRAKIKAYQAKWHKEKMKDPEYREKRRKRALEYYRQKVKQKDT